MTKWSYRLFPHSIIELVTSCADCIHSATRALVRTVMWGEEVWGAVHLKDVLQSKLDGRCLRIACILHYTGTGSSLIFPLKGNSNATACTDISYNCERHAFRPPFSEEHIQYRCDDQVLLLAVQNVPPV